MTWLYVPFLLQGLLMGMDEHLHQKRGLGKWEKIGHPLDTFTVLVPLSMVSINPYSDHLLTVFIILSVFSCFFITKDEFVHTKVCSSFENWLHSLLFVLHPFIFLCTVLLWKFHPADDFIKYQPLIVGSFMTYQIFKWSIPWKEISR